MLHLISVVDTNEKHRQAVSEALLGAYKVNGYGDQGHALADMLHTTPQLILVGQRVGAGSGANFIKDLKRNAAFAEIPIICILDNEDFRIVDAIRDVGIKEYIVKPYRRSDLIGAIEAQVNGKVEQGWQTLPRLQRKALEVSVSTFNNISDSLSRGNPINFEDVDTACVAVVKAMNDSDVSFIINNVKEHDNFTYVHSIRVATFMSLFGKAIGLPTDQQVLLASGGFLHDLGKMKVPRETLNKQDKLTPEEWRLVRGHVAITQRLLAIVDNLPKAVMTVATQHHERIDGSGYPLGLTGKDLNQLARMAGIIDVFTALTDRRAYRRTYTPEAALEVMATEMSRQLDQELLIKFRDILLSTGGADAEA